jgi:AcrR family transcriptional regulator
VSDQPELARSDAGRERRARSRDPQAKRRKLLDAALAEFAAYGLAGAKLDRIARAAQVSSGLPYTFWDGKEALFQAVFADIAQQVAATVPIDADDLPGYAARLHDAAAERPDVSRFLAWRRLESGSHQVIAVEESMADKVAAIAAAQHAGTVTSAMTAGQILAVVLNTATMWTATAEDLSVLVPPARRRQTVIDAVARLVAPE